MTNDVDVSIENIVGVGNIGVEIDLEALSRDLDAETNYVPESYTGLHIRFSGSKGLVTLYRTGSYHIVGVDTVAHLTDLREQFINSLQDLGIDTHKASDSFSVRNYVCTADYERKIDLNTVAILLGLERVEYEPEQFPGLVYKPEEDNLTILLFSSGKCVITGAKSVEEAATAKVRLGDRLTSELD